MPASKFALRSRFSKSFTSHLYKDPHLPFSSFPFDFFHTIQVIFPAFTDTVQYCPKEGRKQCQQQINNNNNNNGQHLNNVYGSGVNNKLTLRPKVNVKQL